MRVVHTFVSPKAEQSDPTIVGPNEWNADHTIIGGAGEGQVIFTDPAIGGVAAVKSNGSVSVAGTTVSGTGTNFLTAFKPGDRITFYPPAQNGAGLVTSYPIAGDIDGSTPRCSCLTGFNGASFSMLAPGDMFTVPIYSGPFTTQPNYSTWSINNVFSATKLRTMPMMDPQVGSGSSYPYVVVNNNTAYVICNDVHGLSTGNLVTITNSGVPGLNGTYAVISALGYSWGDLQSHVFTINTSGVANGTYVNEGLTLSVGMPGPAIIVSVNSNVATLAFKRPHGFKPGDTIYLSGYTGASAWLNGSFVVASVGNGNGTVDYATQLSFSAIQPNGSYGQLTGLIGTTWTYTFKPEQGIVASVVNDTTLTLQSALSRNLPASTIAWNSPDNYAAYQTAVSTAAASRMDIFIPAGDYYFENSQANTGRPGGYISAFNLNNIAIVFSPGAIFYLNRVVTNDGANGSNGFQFYGCSNVQLINWHVDALYLGPWSPIISAFPSQVEFDFSYNCKMLNFTSLRSRGGSSYFEYSENMIADGIFVMNSGGNVIVFDNTSGQISNVYGRNGADEAVYLARNNATSPDLEGITVTNVFIRNTYDGISASVMSGLVVSNAYLESSITAGLMIQGYPGPHPLMLRNNFNNITVANSGCLGPGLQIYGNLGAINIADPQDFQLSNFIIRSIQFGQGLLLQDSLGLSEVSIANGVIGYVPGVGLTAASVKEIFLSDIAIRDTNDSGLFIDGDTNAVIRNVLTERVCKTLGAGGPYGTNVAMNFWGGNNIVASDLTIIDDQTPATGYKLGISNVTFRSRFSGVAYTIYDAAHPFALVNNSPDHAFVEDLLGAVVPIAGTIIPTAQVFPVSGSGTISTITASGGMQPGDKLYLLPLSGWITNTSGNIMAATNAIIGKVLVMTWDGSKFWPSY